VRRGPTPAERAAGDRAEDAVTDLLVARGFGILARRLRLGPLEIDLVATRGDLAVVVEVRTRGQGAYIGPLASVDGKKRDRLVRAAERLWREKLARIPEIARLRFDVAGVTFDAEGAHVEYIEAAFTA
jgi:putative endonuclease